MTADIDFTEFFAATPSPYLVLDADLVICYANPACLRSTGLARDALIGKHFFDALPENPGSHEDVEQSLRASLQRLLHTGQPETAVLQRYDLPRVAVISLAKRVEEVFVPGRSDPILLDPLNPGLQLLQRIRDEAHRFALGFHRQRRDAKARESIFDTLPGVGPARRRALLRHFGSAERFLAASQEELEGVPGIPERTARSIYAQLHKAGRA